MTAFGIALNGAFHSGSCLAVPRQVARAAHLVRGAVQRSGDARPVKDYCLVDGRGEQLGLVPQAVSRPSIGVNAPTVYLRRA